MLYKCPTSLGEIIDKITILEIKSVKFKNSDQLKFVHKEFKLLRACIGDELSKYFSEHRELSRINNDLWEIEDQIRQHEANNNFSSSFIRLARSVYFKNDERGRVKKLINEKSGSSLKEEKNYSNY
mgnify:CR=1 FL=1